MTSPFQRPDIQVSGRGSVTQIDDPLQQAAQFVAQLLARRQSERRAERERQSERDVQQQEGTQPVSPEGVPQATKEEIASFKRFFGRDPNPGEIIGGEAAAFRRKIAQVTLSLVDDPQFARNLAVGTALAATGGRFDTPEGVLEGARAREEQQRLLANSTEAVNQTLASLPEEERRRLQTFIITGTTPNQVNLADVDARTRTKVAEAALEIMTNPEHGANRLIESIVGINAADVAGLSALGADQILNTLLSGQISAQFRESDLEETINNVAESIGTAFNLDPVAVRQVLALKRQGTDRTQVPGNLLPVWDTIEIGQQVAVQSRLGEGFENTPEFRAQKLFLELGRQLEPDSPEYANLANAFAERMKLSLLRTTFPEFDQLESDLFGPDPAARNAAAQRINQLLQQMEGVIPSFGGSFGLFGTHFGARGFDLQSGKGIRASPALPGLQDTRGRGTLSGEFTTGLPPVGRPDTAPGIPRIP